MTVLPNSARVAPKVVQPAPKVVQPAPKVVQPAPKFVQPAPKADPSRPGDPADVETLAVFGPRILRPLVTGASSWHVDHMIVRTTCNRDCPDACGMIVEVENGRVVALRGDPAHPVTRGFLCSQGRDFLKRAEAPDRLTHPLRRSSRGWQRIALDDALDIIAEQLLRVRAEHGPLAVLALRYSGLRGRVQKAVSQLFWGHFGGATTCSGGMCVEALDAAQALDFGHGVRIAHVPQDLVHSQAVVIWGRNMVVTHPHWIPFLDQAKRRGAPIFVIDPSPTATARRAHRHLRIRPGTDRLLATAVARRLIEQDAMDHSFVRDHAHGFDSFRDECLRWPLEELASAVDVPVGEIEELAGVYARCRPTSTLVGLGVCSWVHGGETVRAIDALCAMSGNIGVAGGGVTGDIDFVEGLDDGRGSVVPGALARTVRLPRLGQDILSASDPPLRFGWIAGANPAASAPEPENVRQGLRSLDCLVVVEQFMTATAELADIVLPCTNFLESDDVITSYGHDWIGATRRVVEPAGETRSDVELYQALARRLGFGAALAGDAESWMRFVLRPVEDAGVTVEALRAGARRNPKASAVPLADRRFGTPSRRFEFVRHLTPWQSPPPKALRLVCTKSRRAINFQMLDEDIPVRAAARVHSSALESFGLAGCSEAWLVSPAGKARVELAVDDSLRTDVLVLDTAVWRGDRTGVNGLREATLTDIGCSAAMHEDARRPAMGRRLGRGPDP